MPMPPVSSITWLVTSPAFGSITSVTPNADDCARRDATGSTPTIRAAPAIRAPWAIEMPMPPRPTIMTVAPASTLAVLSTAPTPVCTAQPSTDAMSSGVSSGTLTAPVAGQRAAHRRRAVLGADRELPAHAEVAAATWRTKREDHLVALGQTEDAGAD